MNLEDQETHTWISFPVSIIYYIEFDIEVSVNLLMCLIA